MFDKYLWGAKHVIKTDTRFYTRLFVLFSVNTGMSSGSWKYFEAYALAQFHRLSKRYDKLTYGTAIQPKRFISELWHLFFRPIVSTLYQRKYSTRSLVLPVIGSNWPINTERKQAGGLNLVSFHRSRWKLFTLKFSKESVLTPYCERPKTAQRTLFLSFEINNCFPITV